MTVEGWEGERGDFIVETDMKRMILRLLCLSCQNNGSVPSFLTACLPFFLFTFCFWLNCQVYIMTMVK